MGESMNWKQQIEALALSPEMRDQIIEIVADTVGEIEDEAKGKYDEGFEDGKADAEEDFEDYSPWLDDLETGLRLIDTDRTAAKVYLDRCTKQAGKHLIEVAPCLL